MRNPAALLLALLAALPALAQEQSQRPTFFSETIEVRVVNVDVVVTDKNGKPVTGLTKDDFELFENGVKQPITNFLEMRGNDVLPAASTTGTAPAPSPAAPPADTRARNIVIFVDESSMHPFVRQRVFQPMQTFLQRSVRSGDHVMIVSWTPGLKIELPFTNDLEAMKATLQRLATTGTNTLSADRDRRMTEQQISDAPADWSLQPHLGSDPPKPPLRMALDRAQSYATKVTIDHARRIEAIKSVIASLRGLGGRNALVILTDEITANPALPIYFFIDSVKELFANGETFNPYEAAKPYERQDLPKVLGDLANSCGVTLYPISASGLAIDMGGLSAEHLGIEFTAPARQMQHHDEGLLTLQQIAAQTGGAALTGSNNFDLAFNTLTSDMTTYYSLGYRPAGEQRDVVRDLAVKARNKGYKVRARQSFVEKSLRSEMSDAVSANLMYPIARNDLNVTVSPDGAPAPGADQQTVIPVALKIPTASLTLVPDGSDLVGQFSTYTAFLRDDGKISEVKTQQHQFRFPADTLSRRKEITVKYALTVDAKTETVSVGIMDDTSHATGFATMKLGS